jgi:predicted nicotinamide N-methyase
MLGGQPPIAQNRPTSPTQRRIAAIRRATTVARSPLCPEIRLRCNQDFEQVWAQQAAAAGPASASPPYWAHPWPGGQALARYLLDHPGITRNRRVLDIGSGSGICAIAAAIAGAAVVEAVDTDPWAVDAIGLNAKLNHVRLLPRAVSFPQARDAHDVVLAADLWYERFLGQSVTTHLLALARRGVTVLLGDSNRAHFPRARVDCVAAYVVAAGSVFEAGGPVIGRVFTVREADGPMRAGEAWHTGHARDA